MLVKGTRQSYTVQKKWLETFCSHLLNNTGLVMIGYLPLPDDLLNLLSSQASQLVSIFKNYFPNLNQVCSKNAPYLGFVNQGEVFFTW